MWRNWKSSWRDTSYASYQGLAIAIGLSLLLHWLLIGKVDFNLPDWKEERYLIETRLVLAKPIPVKAKAQPIQENKVESKPEPEQPPEAIPEPETIEPVASPIQDEVVATPEPAEVQPEIIEPVVESEPEPVGLAINPNAYKYVETKFDVRTDIAAKVNSSPAGRAKIVYQLMQDGEQYHLESLMQASGFAALVIPDLLQVSEGVLTPSGLQPTKYLYKFGDKKDKTYSAALDWESKKLTLHSAKGVKELPLVEGTQDLLSFMYQFMFMPPLQDMQLSITNGKKLGTYDYSFAGEEITATKMGDLRTMHILRTASDTDEKTELWLALDYQYVPVKIRKTEKEEKVYELLATSLKTDKPATESE
ncbi:MAG TPA: DUF3108 domain-containing protein [Methylotenera sp.]|nr:DUF3108 domain-containing protein [Methylotenera sp.]